jgi:predicted MFS family arabinose efflux permease
MSEVSVPQSNPPAAPGAAARAGRYAGYIFWLMFLINFINYFDRIVFAGLSPEIQDTLHLTDVQISLAATVFLGTYTIIALPLGFLADRIARKTVVAAGVALWSIASFFTGLANSAAALIGIRTVLGIGEGSYYPAGTPMLAAYYPPKSRSTVFARWSAGALLGGGVGFLAASFFTKGDSWRLAFYFTGLPGLILAALVWFTRHKPHHEEDPADAHEGAPKGSPFKQFIGYVRIPTVRTITLSQALGFFASGSAVTFFTIYVHRTFVTGAPGFPKAGLSVTLQAIVAGGIFLLGSILGTLYGSRLGARLSRRHAGGQIMAGAWGSLLAVPGTLIALGSKYVLNVIPVYTSAPESTRLIVSLALFCFGGVVVAFGLNLYQGPYTSSLLQVVPPSERAGVGGAALAFSHLLGDSYSSTLVAGVEVLLIQAFGGSDQIGLAMLVTWPIALIASGWIGLYGSRFYARDVAAVSGMVGESATTGAPVGHSST